MDEASTLPRRASLGVGLREEDGGVRVTRVVPGSMGEAAGMRAGDVLVALDGAPVRAVEDARAFVRGRFEAATIAFARDGSRREARVARVPFPVEPVPGATVRLGHVTVDALDGARLRTLTTVPDDAAPDDGARHPAVLFVPGVRCASVDLALAPDAPIARIVRGLAATGLATMRLERSGIGDSEGPPADRVGFVDEHAAYRAALEALARAPDVDPDRVFVYGHSVGGMHAALLAHEAPLAGAVVYGSTARRWSACLRDGLRRQMRLRGAREDAVAAAVADFDARFGDDGAYERSAAFHRELDAAGLEDAWSRADVPLLVLAGEHDWVVGDEPRDLAALARRAELVVLDGLDHAFTRHGSLEASLRDYGRGAFDPRLIDVPARWMRGLTG